MVSENVAGYMTKRVVPHYLSTGNVNFTIECFTKVSRGLLYQLQMIKIIKIKIEILAVIDTTSKKN